MQNSADVGIDAEDRYARHRLMDWWDQRRVAACRVVVAGAGAIGNEVVKLLALMGVNNQFIIDYDGIDITNLTRTVLFRDSDVGASKALTAAARAREINPESAAVGLQGDLEFDVGLGVYRAADVVIGCLDSINSRLALNRACLRAGTPWLNGGIEDVFGEVALHAGDSACYECGMSESMWASRNTRYSCGGQKLNAPPERVPTTATIASIVAGYLVNEAMLLVHADSLESKEGLKPGEKMVVSLKPYDFRVMQLTRNPECTCHEKWDPITLLSRRPDELTVRELLHVLGDDDGTVELGYDLLTSMRCVHCGQVQEILMPVEKTEAGLILCPTCKQETRSPMTISWIDAQSEIDGLCLSKLGVSQHQIVAVNGRTGRRYVQLSGESEPFNADSSR